MNINSRSYGGKLFRPTPEVFKREDGLLVIAMPWGPKDSAKSFIKTVSEYCSTRENDLEVTLPFGVLPSLSPLANRLRTALLIANDQLYSEENNSEYQSGVEALAIWRDGADFVCVK